MSKPINTYADGSGGWYVVRSHGRYLVSFDWRGCPEWADRGDGGVRALIFRSRHADCFDTNLSRLLRKDACAEMVKIHAVEVPNV